MGTNTMGTNAIVTTDGRPMLAPLDQYNPYDSHDGCKVCDEPRSAPHAVGCIHGYGFEDVTTPHAREIARECVNINGGWIDDEFLNEFHLAATHRDIVVDDVLHAFEGSRVLVRAINQPGAVNVFLISMVTGDVLRLPRRQFNAATTDADGRLIEAGATVEDIASGVRGTVTTVDFGSKVVMVKGSNVVMTKGSNVPMVKGKHQFGQRGDYLRLLDEITIRWEATVLEAHAATFLLGDVAKALNIPTGGKTPDDLRREVEAAIEMHSGDIGDRDTRRLDQLLSDIEGTAYRDECNPGVESRVLHGHGEG